MKDLLTKIEFTFVRFEKWFNNKFGIYFTNGNKVDSQNDLL